jgi:hypothetical protein
MKPNKFEYFNNQPSKYYNVSFNYFPINGQTGQNNTAPYKITGSSQTCSQLSIDVKLKPEYFKIKKMVFMVSQYISLLTTILIIMSLGCYLFEHTSDWQDIKKMIPEMV